MGWQVSPPVPPDPEPPPSGNYQILAPGNGFQAPLTAPAIGDPSDPTYSAKAIARHNGIPYEIITQPTVVGIPAFHINNIDKVQFVANGGTMLTETALRWNPNTRTREYCVMVRPQDYNPGLVEIRWIATPRTTGVPRIGQGPVDNDVGPASRVQNKGEFSIWLWMDSANSLIARFRFVNVNSGSDANDGKSRATAFASIRFAITSLNSQYGNVENCFIFLANGNYTWLHPTTTATLNVLSTNGWLSILADTGQTAVKINANTGRLITKNLRFVDIEITCSLITNTPGSGGGIECSLWFERCRLLPPFKTVTYAGGQYSRNCYMSGFEIAPLGGTYSAWDQADNLISDFAQGSKFIVNSRNMGIHLLTNEHPDCWKLGHGGWSENRISYNCHCDDADAQGPFFKGTDPTSPPDAKMHDIALVNWQHNNSANPSGLIGQISFGQAEHYLMLNSVEDSATYNFRAESAGSKNIKIAGCSFQSLVFEGYPRAADVNIQIDNNHYRGGTQRLGTNWTEGDPQFVSRANPWDYRPQAGSMLRNRGRAPAFPYDQNGQPMGQTIGALEYNSTPYTEP